MNLAPGASFYVQPIYSSNNLNLVLLYSRLDLLVKDKHSSLLGPFVSYKENEVL